MRREARTGIVVGLLGAMSCTGAERGESADSSGTGGAAGTETTVGGGGLGVQAGGSPGATAGSGSGGDRTGGMPSGGAPTGGAPARGASTGGTPPGGGTAGTGSTADCPGALAANAYGAQPPSVPGTIEAEDFDPAGYSDSTTGNEGGEYRTDVDVDIKQLGMGYAVGWMNSGEWLEYTVNVATPGDYVIDLEVGAVDAGRTVDVSVCGNPLATGVEIPQISAWGETATTTVGPVHLDAGLQVIRVTVGANDFLDFDSMTFEPDTSRDGGTGGTGDAGGTVAGPCDIYASGDTPCVAAHSTVRALYGAYNGNLYQVRRASDRTTRDIGVLTPGGFADSSAQDAFCAGTRCTIATIYDQSEMGNHLTVAPGGGARPNPDVEANASALKLNVGGNAVYAVYVTSGVGYRNNRTTGVATGDEPESMYMVTSGTHYNDQCCFDYGNAETTNNDDGNGTMEAIYFGNCTFWGKGSGRGPWVMADLENGLFGGSTFDANPTNTPLPSDYVTAMLKGRPGGFAIKGGDAQSGALKTMYDGGRPRSGYDPMKKQGAILLGIGGDNSNLDVGTFFEGCMTSGYSSDAIDDAIQANIVAAGYGR